MNCKCAKSLISQLGSPRDISSCINLGLSDENHILNTLFVAVLLFYLAQRKKIPVATCKSYYYPPYPALDHSGAAHKSGSTVAGHGVAQLSASRGTFIPTTGVGQKGHSTPDNFQIGLLGEYVPFWLFATLIDSLGEGKEVMGSQSKVLSSSKNPFSSRASHKGTEGWGRRSRKERENNSVWCRPCISTFLLVLV